MGTKRLPALPPRYGDPFYRGRGRGRGRGRREWLNERPFERSNGGFGRGFSHGNGRGNGDSHQVDSERDHRDRQEEEWSIPASVGRREDILAGQESPHRTLPTPAPLEDRFFTDWSSIGSPCVRMPPKSVLVGETGPGINQPVNQTTQPGSEPAQIGTMGNALQDDIIVSSPRTHQQLDELGVRMMDIGTNTSDIEVRPHRDGARVLTLDVNTQASLLIVDVMLPSGGGDQVTIPQINLSILGYGPYSLRDSHVETPAMRAQEISILPQLDGPVSILMRDPTGGRVSEDTRFVG